MANSSHDDLAPSGLDQALLPKSPDGSPCAFPCAACHLCQLDSRQRNLHSVRVGQGVREACNLNQRFVAALLKIVEKQLQQFVGGFTKPSIDVRGQFAVDAGRVEGGAFQFFMSEVQQFYVASGLYAGGRVLHWCRIKSTLLAKHISRFEVADAHNSIALGVAQRYPHASVRDEIQALRVFEKRDDLFILLE